MTSSPKLLDHITWLREGMPQIQAGLSLRGILEKMKTDFDLRFESWGPVLCIRIMGMPDRDSGEPTEIECTENIFEDDAILDVVRRGLQNMMKHEIDESLHFNGVRVFDPHLPYVRYPAWLPRR